MSKNYQLLDQFIDRKCEVSFHSWSDNTLSATYIYNQFNYQLDDEIIQFKDQAADDDCVITSIPLDKINSVASLNINNVYQDVVTFKANDYIVSVCTLEREFIYPRCYKCGKQILVPEETMWHINGTANYGSHYDDPEENGIINGLNFCDNCIHDFVGEVGEYNE